MVSKHAIYVSVGIILILFFAIANPAQFYFLNDDYIHIPLAASGNFLQTNLLRPVADLTLYIDSLVWSKNATGFHLTNTIIHLFNSFLVYLFIKNWNNKEEKIQEYKPVFAALLFLVYACHSESVFWIIGRGGSLATLCALLSLNCYAYSRSYFSLIASLVFFTAGLFTYESIWVLPIIFGIIQVAEYLQKRKPSWWWTLSFVVLFIIYLIFRLSIDRVYFGNYESGLIQHFDVSRLAYNYLATGLRCFLPPLKNISAFVIVSVVFILTVTVLLFLSWKKKFLNSVITPLFCVVIACLPTISLGIDTHDTEGERFLYFPSFFCCWFIAELIWRLSGLVKCATFIISFIIVFHIFFFYKSANSYRYAGLVSRSFMNGLHKVPKVNRLTALNLPSQYKGALIFRKGFPQAVNWLLPDKFNMINVMSTFEITHPDNIKYSFPDLNDKTANDSALFVEWKDPGTIIFY